VTGVRLEKVVDRDGSVVLYDMFIDDEWHGSRRTQAQCAHYIIRRGRTMRLDVGSLRQQIWRAEKLYKDFIAYAVNIGCGVVQDEIVSNDEQARLLANWWQENAV
jgi:hypothetical protein